MESLDYSFLEKCTKEELIHFIKTKNYFRQLFYYHEVLFRRWDIASRSLLNKQREHNAKLNNLDVKKQDDLARQFNTEKDAQKKLDILQKMEPYDNKLQAWMSESKKT